MEDRLNACPGVRWQWWEAYMKRILCSVLAAVMLCILAFCTALADSTDHITMSVEQTRYLSAGKPSTGTAYAWAWTSSNHQSVRIMGRTDEPCCEVKALKSTSSIVVVHCVIYVERLDNGRIMLGQDHKAFQITVTGSNEDGNGGGNSSTTYVDHGFGASRLGYNKGDGEVGFADDDPCDYSVSFEYDFSEDKLASAEVTPGLSDVSFGMRPEKTAAGSKYADAYESLPDSFCPEQFRVEYCRQLLRVCWEIYNFESVDQAMAFLEEVAIRLTAKTEEAVIYEDKYGLVDIVGVFDGRLVDENQKADVIMLMVPKDCKNVYAYEMALYLTLCTFDDSLPTRLEAFLFDQDRDELSYQEYDFAQYSLFLTHESNDDYTYILACKAWLENQ